MSQGNLKFWKKSGKVREFYNNNLLMLIITVQLSRSTRLNSRETKYDFEHWIDMRIMLF